MHLNNLDWISAHLAIAAFLRWQWEDQPQDQLIVRSSNDISLYPVVHPLGSLINIHTLVLSATWHIVSVLAEPILSRSTLSYIFPNTSNLENLFTHCDQHNYCLRGYLDDFQDCTVKTPFGVSTSISPAQRSYYAQPPNLTISLAFSIISDLQLCSTL